MTSQIPRLHDLCFEVVKKHKLPLTALPKSLLDDYTRRRVFIRLDYFLICNKRRRKVCRLKIDVRYDSQYILEIKPNGCCKFFRTLEPIYTFTLGEIYKLVKFTYHTVTKLHFGNPRIRRLDPETTKTLSIDDDFEEVLRNLPYDCLPPKNDRYTSEAILL